MLSNNESDKYQKLNTKATNYGSITSAQKSSDDTSESNDGLNEDNSGWIRKASIGVYNVGSNAIYAGFGGLKWVLSSTASVGSSVISAGTDKIKRKSSKDKDE